MCLIDRNLDALELLKSLLGVVSKLIIFLGDVNGDKLDIFKYLFNNIS